jgi:hypothetical protein
MRVRAKHSHAHTPWNAVFSKSQIDYILCSRSLGGAVGVANANGQRWFSSDHHPLWLRFEGASAQATKKVFKPSYIGWRPKNEAAQGLYVRNVSETLGLHGDGRGIAQVQSGVVTVELVQDVVELGSKYVRHTTNSTRKFHSRQKPREIYDAERASKSAPPGPERRLARKLERKLRRQWEASLALSSSPAFSSQKPLIELMLQNGDSSVDRTKWSAELHVHCNTKYHDPGETPEIQRNRIRELETLAEISNSNGILKPPFIPDLGFPGKKQKG